MVSCKNNSLNEGAEKGNEYIAKYEQQMVAIENTSEQYALMYQCYSTALQRYYAQRYPIQTFILRGLPAFMWDYFMGFG